MTPYSRVLERIVLMQYFYVSEWAHGGSMDTLLLQINKFKGKIINKSTKNLWIGGALPVLYGEGNTSVLSRGIPVCVPPPFPWLQTWPGSTLQKDQGPEVRVSPCHRENQGPGTRGQGRDQGPVTGGTSCPTDRQTTVKDGTACTGGKNFKNNCFWKYLQIKYKTW